MNTLIVKLGAAGDVVRTTPLLRRLQGHVTWLTSDKNAPLLQSPANDFECVTWAMREVVASTAYDLIINLEDDLETGLFVRGIRAERVFGAQASLDNQLHYTEDSRGWFDMSLISSFGKAEADRLKLTNRRTYQELIFSGLGFQFDGERYLLPSPQETKLSGDIALAPEAGSVWPTKNWPFYDELKCGLEARGMVVNILPLRDSLLEHLADVRSHRCLISGDSLPMHLALGSQTRCVSLFTCTSPWEIFDYGVQLKIISPLLEQHFYQRSFNLRAASAISLEEVIAAAMSQMELSGA